MSKLITVHYTVRGQFTREMPDEFNPKLIDTDWVAFVLGLLEMEGDILDNQYQIDFRLGKEDK